MKTKPAPTKNASSTQPPVLAQSALARLQYEQRRVPLAHIIKSRTIVNPRTNFNTPADAEMVENIKRHGILSDVWVRHAVGREHFELIAGERRWTNAAKAGAVDAPVKIWLDCDDNSARELQIIENLQRENISALEEGRAFKRLLDENGYVVEPDPRHPEKPSLMSEFDKSKTYVYGRIKLVSASKIVVEALEAGKVEPTVALLVARIPDPKLQTQCMAEVIRGSGWGDNREPLTHRQTAEHIEENYMRQLKGAPFNTADATLVPPIIEGGTRVGGGSCADCPMRTGNQGELFDKGRADVCTNPKCYALKAEANWERIAERAKQEGCEVIPPSEASGMFSGYENKDELAHNSRYVWPADKVPEDPEKRTYAGVAKACKASVGEVDWSLPLHVVQSPRTGRVHKLYVRADAKAAFIKAGVKFYEAKTEEKREENAAEIVKARERALREIGWQFRLGALVDGVAASKTIDKLAFTVVSTALGFGSSDSSEDVIATLSRRMPLRDEHRYSAILESYLAELPLHELAAFNVELAIRRLRDAGQDRAAIESLAKAYKIDLDHLENSAKAKREGFRKAKQSMGFRVPRQVVVEAGECYSADRIADGRPVLSFEHEGLHYTVISKNPATAWEMVPLAAYDGKPRDYDSKGEGYEGIIVNQRGIQYALRGPALQLVPRPGQCVKCGCTELDACEGGCSWADDSQSVCTKCQPQKEFGLVPAKSMVGTKITSVKQLKRRAKPAKSKKAKPAQKKRGGLTPEGRAKLLAAMKQRWAARKRDAAKAVPQ